MAQRLGIAAALLGDPGIVILDEPVNGLDPEGIRWIRWIRGPLGRLDRRLRDRDGWRAVGYAGVKLPASSPRPATTAGSWPCSATSGRDLNKGLADDQIGVTLSPRT